MVNWAAEDYAKAAQLETNLGNIACAWWKNNLKWMRKKSAALEPIDQQPVAMLLRFEEESEKRDLACQNAEEAWNEARIATAEACASYWRNKERLLFFRSDLEHRAGLPIEAILEE